MFIPQGFGPLLSAAIKTPADFDKLRYPLITSPKIDGIRVLTTDTPFTRKLKPVPNTKLRTTLEHLAKQGVIGCVDGEITVGSPTECTSSLIFNRTTSAVMSECHEATEYTYWLFDDFTNPIDPYQMRLTRLEHTIIPTLNRVFAGLPVGVLSIKLNIQKLGSQIAHNKDDLLQQEQEALESGFEGIMMRSPTAKYKYKRSTLLENTLVKLKRTTRQDVQEDECQIYGFEELLHNDNPAIINALGLTERSSHKANKRPGNTLGKFLVTAITGKFKGAKFKVGTGRGLTHQLRQYIWDNQNAYLNQCFTFEHQLYGAIDAPRFPIFTRFRAIEDIS